MKYVILKFRQVRQIDFVLLFGVILLSLYGVMNIFNATKVELGNSFARRQLLFLMISLIILYVILLIDYSNIKPFIPLIYYFNIGLLIFTKLFSEQVNGATGWIQLGSFSLQPSEFMKISLIMMLAKVIEDNDRKINSFNMLFKLGIYILIPLLTIVIQPDMGMTLVCFIMSIGILFIAGLNIRVFLGGFLSVVMFFLFIWDTPIIPPYWKNRIMTFLNPAMDIQGNGLQVVQSKIGIGSGGLFGKSTILSNSPDSSYVSQFVPEPQNDFIFAVIGEYFGFIGVVFLLVVFIVIILRMINIAKNSKDVFGELFCVGMIFYMLYAIFQNIGMTLGLVPVTGINLPFISYGGSSILSNMIGMAIVLNINMRKEVIVFND